MRITADDQGHGTEGRVLQLLDGGEERVQVEVRDDHGRSVEMRVAVLGTGIMGAAMAKNIAAAGHEVRVWNRTREKADETGLPAAGTPQEAADGAEVVVTMLRDLDAVKAATDGLDFGDAVWMQSSTVGLGIEELDGPLVDAPVLGTRAPAEAGELTVFLSGPDDRRERVRPVADAVATKVVELSDRVGDATRLKLVLNTWVLMLTEATAELLALAEATGIDPSQVLESLAGGPLDVPYLQTKGKAIVERSFEPQFKLETALKDAFLVRELAARSGVELSVLEAAAARFSQAVDAGHGDEDMAATWYATRAL
jgi:3-hydroxyisobutyrate dehydrogenase